MIKKPKFDEENSDLRSVYYNNYFGMVDGMKYPSNNNRYSGKEKLHMRNSCLQNEEIWVDKLKTGVPDFNRKKYFGSPSSTFINEGTYNNEPVYIKTILAVDLESIKDIKYNSCKTTKFNKRRINNNFIAIKNNKLHNAKKHKNT